jgi:hypothetical protein
VGIKTALKAAVGVTDESTLRVAIEKAAQDASRHRQGLAVAQSRHTAASEAVRAENERLLAAATDGEVIGLDTLRKLEADERDAAQFLKFAEAALAGANDRLATAKAKLGSYLIEQAKNQESQCMREFARIVTEDLKPAYDAIRAARTASEALGVREWAALPAIEHLLTAAAEMTRPAPAAPAKPDPLRLVIFTQSARVERSSGGYSFGLGESAAFEPQLAARLVYEGRAEWVYPDPRQADLIEQARLAAESPRQRPTNGFGLAPIGVNSNYLGGEAA